MSSKTRKARVTITLKPGVLDPAGRITLQALHGLGFDQVADVRIGKTVELQVPPDTSQQQLEDMARKLLVNHVIEDFEVSWA